MLFYGLQKLSMVDFPNRMCATVFTGGCNYRCPFCHNAALVIPESFEAIEKIEEKEVIDYLKTRKGILEGICITGGEPMMHKEIGDFIKRVKNEGFQVKLDSNGSFPDRLQKVIDEGNLDYVAMDVKNSPLRYSETVGIPSYDIEPICESIEILKQGKVDYEFRTTVSKELHTPQDIVAIGNWICGAKNYYLQNYRDQSEQIVGGFTAFSGSELREMADKIRGKADFIGIRGV